ncbi:MAG: (Fe-S)-binding protein [Anaerolineae bacterium]|nr:(Fe-S)-binding protein [Anaerolineae bacterium]
MNEEALRETAEMCALCPKLCRHVCTVATVTRSEADTPNEKCRFAWEGWTRGHFRPDEVRHLYACCLCGLCTAWCEPGWDVPRVMEAARRDAAQAGLAPEPAHQMATHVQRLGNPLGEPPERRLHPIADQVAGLPERAKVLLFFGCNTLYRQPEVAQATLTLMEAAGQRVTVWREEACCGEPLRALGFVDEARASGEALLQAVAASGARRVVFTCPSCLRMVRETYPRLGVSLPQGVEWLHHTTFLLELVRTGKLAPTHPLDWQATYHDPCALGRGLGQYDAPRELLGHLPGVRLVEMFHHRERALCCGAGGGMGGLDLRVAVEAGRKVVSLAQGAGADHLVTACPTCKGSFARHAGEGQGLEVWDVAEVLVAALG